MLNRQKHLNLEEMWNRLPCSTIGPYRLMVRTLRCGRNNPGSNPGLDSSFWKKPSKIYKPHAKNNLTKQKLQNKNTKQFLLGKNCSKNLILNILAYSKSIKEVIQKIINARKPWLLIKENVKKTRKFCRAEVNRNQICKAKSHKSLSRKSSNRQKHLNLEEMWNRLPCSTIGPYRLVVRTLRCH